MTKLDALNNLIVNKLEGQKSNTILEAVNKAIKVYGGAGDAKTNAEAVKQLRECFSKGETAMAATLSTGENPYTFDFNNADYMTCTAFSAIPLSIYIKSIDFSKVDLNNQTTFPCYLGSQIEKVDNLDKIKNQDNISGGFMAFALCQKLKSADITGYKNLAYNPNLLNAMFMLCTELESVDMSNVSLSQATGNGQIFSNCVKLSNIKFKAADGAWYGNVQAGGSPISDFAACPLNKESVDQLITNLAQNNNGITFLLSQTAMDNLTAEVKAKAESRGWTISAYTKPSEG